MHNLKRENDIALSSLKLWGGFIYFFKETGINNNIEVKLFIQ